MKNISAIKLSYDNANRVKYQLYAEFFRFLGIYVWEDCTSIREFFGVNHPPDDDEQILCCMVEPDDSDTIYMDSDHQKALLEKLKLDVGIAYSENDFLEAFDVLSDIFIENDLFRAGLTLQYFRYKNKKTEEAGQIFASAADVVGEKITEGHLSANRYMAYAKLYCLQKSNLSYVLCEKSLTVLESDLVEKCLALLTEFPDFSNVWTLIGMVYEKSNGKSRELLAAFENALQMTGDRPFVSSIYYWMGKRYEVMKLYDDAMENAYKKAYQCAPKYRTIYKMGVAMEKMQDWDRAVGYYDECIRFLDAKGKYLDPLELEYYFKTHIRAAYVLIMKQEKFSHGIMHVEQALNYRKEFEHTLTTGDGYSAFAGYVYGDDFREFLRMAFDRMNPERAGQYLIVAYNGLGMKTEETV